MTTRSPELPSSDPEQRELLQYLDQWEAVQQQSPTIFDVIATDDGRLIGAFILRGFRVAAKQAVEKRKRAELLRAVALEKFAGDTEQVEVHLRRTDALLDNRTPLEAAVQSEGGLAAAICALKGTVGEP